MAEAAPPVAPQFDQPEQQREAAYLGMWLFLATEAMTFGGVFLVILFYRSANPAGVHEAVKELHAWLAGVNSAVLLVSSLTMTLALEAAKAQARRRLALMLGLTAALGLAFLAIKGFEYYSEYAEGLMPHVGDKPFPLQHPAARLFIDIYFFATGLHAFHLTAGIVVLLFFMVRVMRGGLPLPERQIVFDMTGLYWHFVDIVWIFLYPALYLLSRTS